jgi:copper oxidase (laccase) domain-containing protein
MCTTRVGGMSTAPFDGFNLAEHVGDDPQAVVKNRELLHS